jgi:hypothetical protein
METSVRSSTIDGSGNDHKLKDQKLVEHPERSDALYQVRTARSIVMSRAVLVPLTSDVKGHLRSTFGNPTPL